MITARCVRGVVLSWCAAVLVACGSVTPTSPDALPADAPVTPPTDAPDERDAPIDAPDAPPPPDAPDPTPGQELTSAGGQLRGATFTLDVELGHGWSQRPLAGAAYQLEAHPAIAP